MGAGWWGHSLAVVTILAPARQHLGGPLLRSSAFNLALTWAAPTGFQPLPCLLPAEFLTTSFITKGCSALSPFTQSLIKDVNVRSLMLQSSAAQPTPGATKQPLAWERGYTPGHRRAALCRILSGLSRAESP